ncbi:MAG: F0F1 ATP synthase subunit epsilon [Actinomycetota bacterium]|nr:F0F1 ATP synthase subunit epsilon [Actinomycetota bacterium]
MAEPMRVEVVSPEDVLFSGEATQVITRTAEGEVAFLADHAPFLGLLVENETRIWTSGGQVVSVLIPGGFVEVSDNTVSILCEAPVMGGDDSSDTSES